ncbi:MAG: nucleotidyltransferase domain-containing protein [Planctomycetes bacterium]|nr:nucleotidyltransferase domain-containing protein [Planctomycetota bacterium]
MGDCRGVELGREVKRALPGLKGQNVVNKDAIREAAKKIAREFHPDRIILFGSHAHGHPTPDSDVDLLVVVPHEGKDWRMAARIRGCLRVTFPLDLLVRTPEEMERRIAEGDPFLADIQRTGEVLYENRDH